jgi:hypothetical protein
VSNSSTVSTQSRRSFFKKTAAGAAVAIPSLAVINGTEMALAGPMPSLNDGDVAVLQFLAAAELVEGDLWGQYCDLATNNPGYRNALQKIDESLPDYIRGVFKNECSHATFINAFLIAAGKTPINLDAFRTLPSVPVEGAKDIGRLTNLKNLTVDTSYYQRYRQAGNPDFGDAFPRRSTSSTSPPSLPQNRLAAMSSAPLHKPQPFILLQSNRAEAVSTIRLSQKSPTWTSWRSSPPSAQWRSTTSLCSKRPLKESANSGATTAQTFPTSGRTRTAATSCLKPAPFWIRACLSAPSSGPATLISRERSQPRRAS